MKYREWPSPPELAQSVECFWLLESSRRAANVPPQRILPDGCAELILNFADPFAERCGTGFVSQPTYFVVGQMEEAKEILPTGRVNTLGVRFQPAGARQLLGVPMQELNGQVIPLGALQRQLAAAAERARGAGETRESVRIIQQALIRRAAGCKEADVSVQGPLARLLESDGRASIEELAVDCGISRRQLERKFRDWVGLTPKTLSRILRFQRVFRTLESRAANWADVAAECGYYDQSHLIRDFRKFAGECPSVLNVAGDSLTEAFLRRRRLSQFSKTPGNE